MADQTPADRESVTCPHCAAAPAEPCEFPTGEPWMVTENGVQRRVVHAARYAATLPPEERSAFWRTAVDEYMSRELAALDPTPATTPGADRD